MVTETANIVFFGFYDLAEVVRLDMRRSWNGSSS